MGLQIQPLVWKSTHRNLTKKLLLQLDLSARHEYDQSQRCFHVFGDNKMITLCPLGAKCKLSCQMHWCGADRFFQDWIHQKDNLHAHLVQNVDLKVKCTFVEFMTRFKTKSTRKTQSCQVATIDLQLHSHLVQNTYVESLKPHEHQSL
jgi:hypothetical protein